MRIDPGTYKNIIFDFGGVIINVDYHLTARAFQQLGLDNFDELYSKAKQSSLFDEYEKGLISSAGFRAELKRILRADISDAAIDKAWNAMLLDLPQQRLELLARLKLQYRTFLLSNTNEIHIETIMRTLQAKTGMKDLSAFFERIYFSYEVKMRKPDACIFELVLRENNLAPGETLFIDDSPQHTEAAEKLGIHTHRLDVHTESILDLF